VSLYTTKKYYKFWWSEELNCLKDKAIKSDKMWKEAGRPRSGPIANVRYADKRNYKRKFYSEREAERRCHTNDLHDALMSKSGASFWKCWKSKFNRRGSASKFIDGLSDEAKIADAFAEHFRKTCTSFSEDQNIRLQSIYHNRRQNYVDDPFLDKYKFFKWNF